MNFLSLIRKQHAPPLTVVPVIVQEPEVQPEVALPASVIKTDPEDCPAFIRHYYCPLTALVSLEIDARTSYDGTRRYSGWLRQFNGKLVLFDPQAIAERIIDRELLPLLETICPPIIMADRQFINSEPGEFHDRNGVRWIRASGH